MQVGDLVKHKSSGDIGLVTETPWWAKRAKVHTTTVHFFDDNRGANCICSALEVISASR